LQTIVIIGSSSDYIDNQVQFTPILHNCTLKNIVRIKNIYRQLSILIFQQSSTHFSDV